MKKCFYPLMIALAIISCDNAKSPNAQNDSTSQAVDTVIDLSKLSIPKARNLDAGQIPKYNFLSAQSGSSGVDEIRPSGPAPSCTDFPTKIADLTSYTDYDLYQFNADKSAEAAAFGFKGTIGKKELLIVEEYKRWKEVDCGGVKKKYGIGLRCYIHVTQMKGGVEGALSAISAKVELKSGRATFNLKSMGFGIDGGTIADGLTSSGQYDVESFAKLRIIYNNTLKTLSDTSNKKISPVELP